LLWRPAARDLHAYPYFSKVASFPPQGGDQVGRPLPHGGGYCAGGGRQFQSAFPNAGHANAIGQRARQLAADDDGQRSFVLQARRPGGNMRVGSENARKRCSDKRLRRILSGVRHGA
jgi:hypothetical protein